MARSKWLAEMFHSFPHLDFDFQNTTSVFTPTETSYRQALMFNGLIILFIALLLFLVFTFYFLICSCYYCSSCFPSTLKPRPSKSRSLRFLIVLFAVISCAPLGLGFYGNNKTMDGVDAFSKAATDIYNRWDLFKFKHLVVTQFIRDDANKSINKLKQALDQFFIPVPVLLTNLSKLLKETIKDLGINGQALKGSDFVLKTIADQAKRYDEIRWWTTIGIHLWHLLLVLSVIYGAWRERRHFIAIIAIQAILSLLFMLASIGIEVPLSVGAADICIYPKSSITQYIKNPAYKEIQNYYLDCFNGTGNPIFKNYNTIMKTLNTTDKMILNLEKDAAIVELMQNTTVPYLADLHKTIEKSKADVTILVTLMDCKYINQRYKDGINAVCFTVLNGLGLLILAAMIISLFVVCKLLCITPIWKSMAKLRSILRRTAPGGVHLVTESYSGPPGGSEHFPDSSWDTSLDASYKSIDDDQRDPQRAGRYDTSETVPLVLRHGTERPPSYHAVHGDTEFLSVEEDRKRHQSAESET